MKFTVDESKGASISGGPLTDSYTLTQFHLHWGSDHGQGSEHTLNGKRYTSQFYSSHLSILFYSHFSYDAELHLVHYKSSFNNLSDAVASNESDALAVVGILLQEASAWDQYVAGRPSQTQNNLRKAALELSRPWRGPGAPSVEVEVVLDQFISEIT